MTLYFYRRYLDIQRSNQNVINGDTLILLYSFTWFHLCFFFCCLQDYCILSCDCCKDQTITETQRGAKIFANRCCANILISADLWDVFDNAGFSALLFMSCSIRSMTKGTVDIDWFDSCRDALKIVDTSQRKDFPIKAGNEISELLLTCRGGQFDVNLPLTFYLLWLVKPFPDVLTIFSRSRVKNRIEQGEKEAEKTKDTDFQAKTVSKILFQLEEFLD